jgi:hypothetical protein
MLKHEPTLAAFAQAFERSGADEPVNLSKTVGEAR